MLIKTRKKPIIIFMRIKWFFFEQNWIPFTQGYFVLSLVEISSVDFLISSMDLRYFAIISLEKGGALH